MFIEALKDAGQSINKSAGPNEIPSEEIIVGTLAIYAVRDADTWHGGTDEDDQYLGINFVGPEWKAIFYDVLKCPKPEMPTNGEDVSEYQQRYLVSFEQYMSKYPMLARISDMYEDVGYKPEEVHRLRQECLIVQSLTDNQEALEGLKKLIYACDEALKRNSGLYLASD